MYSLTGEWSSANLLNYRQTPAQDASSPSPIGRERAAVAADNKETLGLTKYRIDRVELPRQLLNKYCVDRLITASTVAQ